MSEPKREAVSKVYSSKRWAEKVKKMSDAQVIAIYFKFKREGKIK